MNLFTKSFAFLNIGVLFQNYKIDVQKIYGQNINEIDIFEDNENINVKKKKKTIIDLDYDSNNMLKATYLIVGHAFFITSKVNCHLSCILYFLY